MGHGLAVVGDVLSGGAGRLASQQGMKAKKKRGRKERESQAKSQQRAKERKAGYARRPYSPYGYGGTLGQAGLYDDPNLQIAELLGSTK